MAGSAVRTLSSDRPRPCRRGDRSILEPVLSLALGFNLNLTHGMVATAYRYIVSGGGARGGHARVEGMRIGVHDVVSYFLLGCGIDEVVARFPDLSKAQIYECLAYYEDHRAEVEALALSQTEKPSA